MNSNFEMSWLETVILTFARKSADQFRLNFLHSTTDRTTMNRNERHEAKMNRSRKSPYCRLQSRIGGGEKIQDPKFQAPNRASKQNLIGVKYTCI